jgi:hypothetical protein
MDARKTFWSALVATLAWAGGNAATAADQHFNTIAPTVTMASCETGGCDLGCSDLGNCCDSSGDCGSCSGLFSGLFRRHTDCDACELSCDGGCDAACNCGSEGLLGMGIVKPSDKCFNDFISPMTNPVFFEDPRTLSEVRFIFLSHELPPALGGNTVQVYAMQVRAALTKRLSLIATKDGFIYTQSPVLDSGFADIAAGLKYNLYRDTCAGRLLSAGMTFEVPSGSNRSLQGNGNGEFHFFVTGGTRIGDKAHWISAGGIREPADTSLENRVMCWSNHLDRQIGDRPLYVFTELNWYNYTSSATAFPLPLEGGDLFNLGSPGITGNDLVTHAIGLKAKPRSNMEAGFAWEYPMTTRQGLMENRITADLIVRY